MSDWNQPLEDYLERQGSSREKETLVGAVIAAAITNVRLAAQITRATSLTITVRGDDVSVDAEISEGRADG